MNGYYLYRKAWRFRGAPHQERRLEKHEWKALLRHGGLMVRNTYDFDQEGENSFWYVVKDRFGGMEELSSNERNKVRRSLEKLDFRRISIEQVADEGYPILKATYQDYAVDDRPMTQAIFDKYMAECRNDDFDYWGIFDKEDGKMIGFCTVWLWERSCEYGLIGIMPEYKKNNTYPYYGLFHSMNQHYLQEKGLEYVADGARSITEHSHIQEYLMENFNFRKAYCKMEIHYQWWMKAAVAMLFPFRNIVRNRNVKAILNMEAMQHEQQ